MRGLTGCSLALLGALAGTAVAASPSPAESLSEVRLRCEGLLERNVDAVLAERKQTLLDVALRPEAGVAAISGFWGCGLGDCSIARIRAYPDRITHFRDLADEQMRHAASFELNRHSGLMHVSGTFIANAKSGTKWTVIDYSGTLQCRVADRLF